MIKIIVTLLLLLPSFCFGAIDNASVSDGSFTLSGSGFGTHALGIITVESNVEAGTPGAEVTLPSGWNADTTSAARKRPVYSNEWAHSGNQSIKSYFPLESQYTSGFGYDSGSAFTSAYVSWWVHADNFGWGSGGPTIGQWKVFRVTPGLAGGTYEDQPHNWYWAEQFNAITVPDLENGNNMFTHYCMSNTTPTYDTSCYGGEATGEGIYRYDGLYQGVAQRVEVWVKQSSVSTQDGSIVVRIQKEGYAPVYFVNYDDETCTRQSTDYPWRDLVWENYVGNGVDQADIYIDDIYIQYGTQARVEIGNASTFAACTHREVQPALTWDNDEITGTFNLGSFAPDATVYFFVVDEDGVASDGYPVDLSGTPTYDSPTITGPDDFSTTASSVEIEGTYTIDSELADQSVVVTWTLGEDSGFAVAALGVFSCTVPVELGVSNIVFEITDSNSGTGSYTTVITRTALKASGIRGAAVVKNATIH